MSKDCILISMEGIDKAGKTTQVHLLNSLLCRHNLLVKIFKFPNYSTKSGERIYRIITGIEALPPREMLRLFSINRMEDFDNINSAIFSNDVVIFDRYSESAYAYGLALGLSYNWLCEIESQLPIAHLVILLDLDPQIAIMRCKSSAIIDVFERDMLLQVNARHYYLEITRRSLFMEQEWFVIDASESIENVHHEIVKIVLDMLTCLPKAVPL